MQNNCDEDSFFALIGSESTEHVNFRAAMLAQPTEKTVCLSNKVGVLASFSAQPNQKVIQIGSTLAIIHGRPAQKGGPERTPGEMARYICTTLRSQGANGLRNLTGQFRIVILDQEAGISLVATDYLGTLPVVYSKLKNGSCAFASDSSLLLDITGQSRVLNHSAIYDYLFFHQTPAPQSVYTGIRRMLPGEAVSLANEKIEIQHYWNPEFRAGESSADAPSPGELLPVLRQAVAATLPDESTACFLSGGLDSSSVVGTLALSRDRLTHAFTIGFDEPGYDETEYARLVAKHFNLELHEYYLTPEDVADTLPLISAAYDEPFGNSSAVPAYFCALRAREAGFTKLLAGDGGDELFAGNARYAKQKLFEQYFRLPGSVRRILESDSVSENTLYRKLWPLRKLSRYVEQATQPLPDRLESANPLHYFQNDQIFDAGFLCQIDQTEPYNLMRDWYSLAASDNFLNKMLWLDWKFTLSDNDLRKVTVMCRQAGVQVCYPMLDERLINLSVRIPPAQKLRGYDLRTWYKAGVRGFLPQAILDKKKHGFGLPFGEWLRKPGAMRDMAASSLDNAAQLGIFSEQFVCELRRRHESVHASHYGSLAWVVIMLEQWLTSRKLSL